MKAFLVLVAAVSLFLIQREFYKRKWSDGLDVRLGFADRYVTEGDTSALTEEITNRKWLPIITLGVKFTVSRHLDFDRIENNVLTDLNYRNDIFSVSGYERITRSLPFTCRRRGFYHIGLAELLSADIFRTVTLASPVKQDAAIYVYPGYVNADKFEVPFRKLMGTVVTRRITLEDPFEFRGIRDYDVNDNIRDINWKASARTGILKVNQHNYTASQKVTILLNLESDSNWEYEKLFEESIRIAAAFAGGCIDRGVPVSLITNARDCSTGGPVLITSGSGESHRTAILQSLARIDESKSPGDFVPFIDEEAAQSDTSSIYVLISRVQRQKLLEAYSSLCRMSPGSQWIAPLHPDMHFAGSACPEAVTYRWEVPYVG